ncbi:MAG: hypothetical protein O0X93_01585 [Methanocorpusculum sp.]|nr:hypothetical protein [Methanocorpusculum sp.]
MGCFECCFSHGNQRGAKGGECDDCCGNGVCEHGRDVSGQLLKLALELPHVLLGFLYAFLKVLAVKTQGCVEIADV